MKFMNSVVSLRYDFCTFATAWSRLSTDDDIHSMGPSQPDKNGLPQALAYESLQGCKILGCVVGLAFVEAIS